jgi:hypothetical protein
MWLVDERLVLMFQMIRKMFRLGRKAKDDLMVYCTSNSPLLASSNAKGRSESS